MSFLIMGRGISLGLFAAPPISPCGTKPTSRTSARMPAFVGKSGNPVFAPSFSGHDPTRTFGNG
jgi:hypothetical protein